MKTQQSDGGNLITALYKSVFARPEPARQDDYFMPRLAEADRQLQVLAKRFKGSYQAGTLDWQTLSSGWGHGARVQKKIHGQEIEVSIGAELFGTLGLVLVPGVSVSGAPSSAARAVRFDASWSVDEENATGADRLRLLRSRGPASDAARDTMPPAIASARARLIEKAAKIACEPNRVFVIGLPLPRAPEAPRDIGQGNFDPNDLIDLIDRSRAFAHALATG